MTEQQIDALINKSADRALEKEVSEKGQGFLCAPYTNYRYHNGFEAGAHLLKPALLKALEALELCTLCPTLLASMTKAHKALSEIEAMLEVK